MYEEATTGLNGVCMDSDTDSLNSNFNTSSVLLDSLLKGIINRSRCIFYKTSYAICYSRLQSFLVAITCLVIRP